jgi:hypothetical protein
MIIDDLTGLMRLLNFIVLLAVLFEWGRALRQNWPIQPQNWTQGELAEALAFLTALAAMAASLAITTRVELGQSLMIQSVLLAYALVVACLIWLRYR